ncbi:glutathione peroxidase [Edaphobacter albus]|uniref:glutathione peroxidase n=1 Tax=Edaphobacter sp. 4G125 TaxID=2763071 RepID=UPI0016451E78|nr:glutathione peroxidase [Edaphobacter sp. 4G125]QNI37626.1 glutathione peroxidase [Edaphobacter sp. 4G125]
MPNLYDIPLQRIDGTPTSLADYRDKVLLLVNVASQCGLTPQYEALEKLYSQFKDSGLVVCGFPANDFGAQEPGTNDEIAAFCRANYSVDFPIFSKIAVTGPSTHPLYQALIAAQPNTTSETRSSFRERLNGFLRDKHNGATTNPEPGILWNFEKFLVDRKGNVIARFSPEVTPDDPKIVAAIESALAS